MFDVCKFSTEHVGLLWTLDNLISLSSSQQNLFSLHIGSFKIPLVQ